MVEKKIYYYFGVYLHFIGYLSEKTEFVKNKMKNNILCFVFIKSAKKTGCVLFLTIRNTSVCARKLNLCFKNTKS